MYTLTPLKRWRGMGARNFYKYYVAMILTQVKYWLTGDENKHWTRIERAQFTLGSSYTPLIAILAGAPVPSVQSPICQSGLQQWALLDLSPVGRYYVAGY